MAEAELRRLVAELARSRHEDIEAVLEGLEPKHRQRVALLLAGEGPSRRWPRRAGIAQPAARQPDLSALPAWLTSRIEVALAGSLEGTFRGAAFLLAPAARDALSAEALSLAPTEEAPSPSQARQARPRFSPLLEGSR